MQIMKSIRTLRPLFVLAAWPVLAVAQTASTTSTPGYTPGYYTTTSQSTTTSSTDASGVTTSTTNTSTNVPAGIYSTRGRDRDSWRNRGSDGRTSDIEARYPYDNTNGRNRSDVDAVRRGFDDPRNPWDGRYMNDNPANSAVGAGANETVNGMRGSDRNVRYRPGNYGTRSLRSR